MLKKLKSNFKFLFFGASYWIKRFILRQNIPFIGGYVLNESCNLNCSHCQVASNSHDSDPSFEQAMNGIDMLYNKGARLLAITGGEPFYWNNHREKQLEELIIEAKRKGFRRVNVYTNGTFPLESSADTIFVSLDGRRDTSKKLRGDIYDKVMTNINNSSHENIIINFTINALNYQEVEPFCLEIAQNPKIKGVFYYFHTPYYGRDELFVDFELKRKIIDLLLDMKKRKLPVFNSKSALKAVYNDSWNRPTNFCQVYANGQVIDCCRAYKNKDACDNCGYLGYVEVGQIMKLHPSAILGGFKYI